MKERTKTKELPFIFPTLLLHLPIIQGPSYEANQPQNTN